MTKRHTKSHLCTTFNLLFISMNMTGCFQRGLSDTNIIQSEDLTISPYSVPADGKTALEVIVNISNALNISTQNINIILVEDSSLLNISQPEQTHSNGQAIGYLTSNTVGDFTIQANIILNGKQIRVHRTGTAHFTHPPETIQLTATPNTLMVVPNQRVNIHAIVQTGNRQFANHKKVSFSSNIDADIIQKTAYTNSQVEAFTTLSSIVSGVYTITARTQTAETTTDIEFSPTAASMAHCFVILDPNVITSTGSSYAIVTVTLKDQYLNPITNA